MKRLQLKEKNWMRLCLMRKSNLYAKIIPQELDFSLTSGVLLLYSIQFTGPKFEWHEQRLIHHLFW